MIFLKYSSCSVFLKADIFFLFLILICIVFSSSLAFFLFSYMYKTVDPADPELLRSCPGQPGLVFDHHLKYDWPLLLSGQRSVVFVRR